MFTGAELRVAAAVAMAGTQYQEVRFLPSGTVQATSGVLLLELFCIAEEEPTKIQEEIFIHPQDLTRIEPTEILHRIQLLHVQDAEHERVWAELTVRDGTPVGTPDDERILYLPQRVPGRTWADIDHRLQEWGDESADAKGTNAVALALDRLAHIAPLGPRVTLTRCGSEGPVMVTPYDDGQWRAWYMPLPERV